MGLVTIRQAAAEVVTATIAAGQALSGAVDLQGMGLIRIDMPAGWDAAALTLQTSEAQAGTFRDVYNEDGTELALTVAAGRAVVVEPARLPGVRWLKLRSGTGAAPVLQTAERSVELVVRPV